MTDWLPIAVLALVCGITPGPSTILAAGIGAGHGFLKAMPHIAGTGLGYALLSLIVVGIFSVVAEYDPAVSTGLSSIGCIAILWLAWHIAMSSVGTLQTFPPLTLWTSTILQGLNPKAWAMVAAAAAITPELEPAPKSLIVGATFFVLLSPGVAVWALGGCMIGSWLDSPLRRRLFNCAMSGALLIMAAGIGLAGT